MTFVMGAFEKDDYLLPYLSSHTVAFDYNQYVIPVGESDIISDMPIWEQTLQCSNENFEKPLYILYSLANEYKPIAISNSINEKLHQLACDAKQKP